MRYAIVRVVASDFSTQDYPLFFDLKVSILLNPLLNVSLRSLQSTLLSLGLLAFPPVEGKAEKREGLRSYITFWSVEVQKPRLLGMKC